jgi:hypothetical protein
MTRTARTALLLTLVCAMPGSTAAQSRRPPLRPPQPPPTPTHPTFATFSSEASGQRFLTFGGAFELPSNFDVGIRPLDFAEPATVDTRYSTNVLPGFDIGGGRTVWRQLAVAVDFERVWKSGRGDVSAQVPHPFFFNRLRAVSGEASSLQRTETTLNFQALWSMPIAPRIDLGFGGGPSWIWLQQDLVRDVTVAQTYPYDTAAFGGVVTQRDTQGSLGFNAGVTLDYRFAQRLSAQLTTRYSHARVRFDSADTGSIDVTAGGVRIGAGLRIPF